MTPSHIEPANETPDPGHVFDDPVAYLESLGVESEIIEETVLPIAA